MALLATQPTPSVFQQPYIPPAVTSGYDSSVNPGPPDTGVNNNFFNQITTPLFDIPGPFGINFGPSPLGILGTIVGGPVGLFMNAVNTASGLLGGPPNVSPAVANAYAGGMAPAGSNGFVGVSPQDVMDYAQSFAPAGYDGGGMSGGDQGIGVDTSVDDGLS